MLPVTAYIVIIEFDDVSHLIFIWKFQDRLNALGLSGFRFYFKRYAFAFHSECLCIPR